MPYATRSAAKRETANSRMTELVESESVASSSRKPKTTNSKSVEKEKKPKVRAKATKKTAKFDQVSSSESASVASQDRVQDIVEEEEEFIDETAKPSDAFIQKHLHSLGELMHNLVTPDPELGMLYKNIIVESKAEAKRIKELRKHHKAETGISQTPFGKKLMEAKAKSTRETVDDVEEISSVSTNCTATPKKAAKNRRPKRRVSVVVTPKTPRVTRAKAKQRANHHKKAELSILNVSILSQASVKSTNVLDTSLRSPAKKKKKGAGTAKNKQGGSKRKLEESEQLDVKTSKLEIPQNFNFGQIGPSAPSNKKRILGDTPVERVNEQQPEDIHNNSQLSTVSGGSSVPEKAVQGYEDSSAPVIIVRENEVISPDPVATNPVTAADTNIDTNKLNQNPVVMLTRLGLEQSKPAAKKSITAIESGVDKPRKLNSVETSAATCIQNKKGLDKHPSSNNADKPSCDKQKVKAAQKKKIVKDSGKASTSSSASTVANSSVSSVKSIAHVPEAEAEVMPKKVPRSFRTGEAVAQVDVQIPNKKEDPKKSHQEQKRLLELDDNDNDESSIFETSVKKSSTPAEDIFVPETPPRPAPKAKMPTLNETRVIKPSSSNQNCTFVVPATQSPGETSMDKTATVMTVEGGNNTIYIDRPNNTLYQTMYPTPPVAPIKPLIDQTYDVLPGQTPPLAGKKIPPVGRTFIKISQSKIPSPTVTTSNQTFIVPQAKQPAMKTMSSPAQIQTTSSHATSTRQISASKITKSTQLTKTLSDTNFGSKTTKAAIAKEKTSDGSSSTSSSSTITTKSRSPGTGDKFIKAINEKGSEGNVKQQLAALALKKKHDDVETLRKKQEEGIRNREIYLQQKKEAQRKKNEEWKAKIERKKAENAQMQLNFEKKKVEESKGFVKSTIQAITKLLPGQGGAGKIPSVASKQLKSGGITSSCPDIHKHGVITPSTSSTSSLLHLQTQKGFGSVGQLPISKAVLVNIGNDKVPMHTPTLPTKKSVHTKPIYKPVFAVPAAPVPAKVKSPIPKKVPTPVKSQQPSQARQPTPDLNMTLDSTFENSAIMDDSFRTANETSMFEGNENVNTYDITVYEDLDENMEHRANKRIPDWASNSDELNRVLYLQQPALLGVIRKEIFPPKNPGFKLFPNAPRY